MALFSKRHCEAIAAVLRANNQDYYDQGKYAELSGAWFVCIALSNLFKRDNSRFDSGKFYRAVQYKDKP